MTKRWRRRPLLISFWNLMLRTASMLVQPELTFYARILPRRKPIHIKEVDQWVVDRLPNQGQTIVGSDADPMNLLFVATMTDIKKAFKLAGWHDSVGHHPIAWIQAGIAFIWDLRWSRGPMNPVFVGNRMQDLDFQKEFGDKPSYNRRHHLRIWQTRYRLADGRSVWICAASKDAGWHRTAVPPFMTHEIVHNLNLERELVVNELKRVGCIYMGKYKLYDPKEDVNGWGDKYQTDGEIHVLEFPRGAK